MKHSIECVVVNGQVDVSASKELFEQSLLAKLAESEALTLNVASALAAIYASDLDGGISTELLVFRVAKVLGVADEKFEEYKEFVKSGAGGMLEFKRRSGAVLTAYGKACVMAALAEDETETEPEDSAESAEAAE